MTFLPFNLLTLFQRTSTKNRVARIITRGVTSGSRISTSGKICQDPVIATTTTTNLSTTTAFPCRQWFKMDAMRISCRTGTILVNPIEVDKDRALSRIESTGMATSTMFLQDEDTESQDIASNMQCNVPPMTVDNSREENGKSSSPIPIFSSSPGPIFSTNPSFLHERREEQQNHTGTYRATNYIKMAERSRVRVTRSHCPLTNFDDSFYKIRSPEEATAAVS